MEKLFEDPIGKLFLLRHPPPRNPLPLVRGSQTTHPMKLLLLIPFLFCAGCQVAYTGKDGSHFTGGFNPSPKEVASLEGLAR